MRLNVLWVFRSLPSRRMGRRRVLPKRIKVIYYGSLRVRVHIITAVRRLIPSLLCLIFTLSLYASVPSVPSASGFSQRARGAETLNSAQSKQRLPITAAPADNRSFYVEFYGTETLPAKTQRKSGLFSRFASAIKRTARKVNFISN